MENDVSELFTEYEWFRCGNDGYSIAELSQAFRGKVSNKMYTALMHRLYRLSGMEKEFDTLVFPEGVEPLPLPAEHHEISEYLDKLQAAGTEILNGIFDNASAVDTICINNGDKSWRTDFAGEFNTIEPLSPCCNALTFIEGTRRVCDNCRLSKPL